LLLKTPLGGYRKLYFWNKKYRIVYKIDGETVYVLAIGKRENKNVYDAALNRI
jgi:mRNA-degrading endonuclease RelE of RelBE toxin-antitoxin system